MQLSEPVDYGYFRTIVHLFTVPEDRKPVARRIVNRYRMKHRWVAEGLLIGGLDDAIKFIFGLPKNPNFEVRIYVIGSHERLIPIGE